MNKIILLTIAILSTSYFTNVFSQVTIGSGLRPVEGALLDLKEFEPATAGGSNSKKGLLLPRVNLSKLNSMAGIDGVTESEYISHAGLMVYNLNKENCESLFPGVHIWSGTSWNRIGKNVFFKTGHLKDSREGDVVHEYVTGHFKVLPEGATQEIDAGEWMLENLKTKVYDKGIVGNKKDLVLHLDNTQPDADVAYFTYPNKDISRFEKEGYYYSGVAALNNELVDGIFDGAGNVPKRIVQGICPDGWRIPTYEDWILLSNVLAQSGCDYAFPKVDDNKIWGSLIKSGNTNSDFKSRPLQEGGFEAYPAGNYNNDGSLNETIGKYPTFITTYPVPIKLNAGGPVYPMYGLFSFTESDAHSQFHTSPSASMPVRCVKGKTPPKQITDYNLSDYNFLPN